MGYAGGVAKAPTYHNLGDHSESIQLLFNPEVITYRDLLASFWEQHNPRHPSYARQYRSAVFFVTQQQQEIALAVKEQLENSSGGRLYTEIEAAGQFTLAEDYHQKYYLQHNHQLMELLSPLFSDLQALFDSTVAARLNAFLAGNTSEEQVFLACEQAGFSSQVIGRIEQTLHSK